MSPSEPFSVRCVGGVGCVGAVGAVKPCVVGSRD